MDKAKLARLERKAESVPPPDTGVIGAALVSKLVKLCEVGELTARQNELFESDNWSETLRRWAE